MFFFHPKRLRLKKFYNWAKSYKALLPERFYDLEFLETFDLSFRGIKSLPTEIDCMPNLKSLNLSGNELSELPWGIAQLKELKSIQISYNRIPDFPNVLCRLRHLEAIYLDSNLIKKVPPTLHTLTLLRELHLANNKIIELPSEIGSLSKIEILDISCNELTSLTNGIGKLYKLKELKLGLNKFPEKPEVLSKLQPTTQIIEDVTTDYLNSMLMANVKCGHPEQVVRLINFGADINQTYSNESNTSITSPLFEATSLEVIKILLARGADPNLKRQRTDKSAKEGEMETFLTKKHNSEITKYIKEVFGVVAR